MKIALLCNTKSSEIPNRLELIDDLICSGYEVYFGAIFDGKINDYYNNTKNAYYLQVHAFRKNLNPLKELKTIFSLKKSLMSEKIDSVIIYGVKNHPSMALAAHYAGIKNIICVVNGKGNLFTVRGIKGMLTRFMAIPALKIAYKISKIICFQNKDDQELFCKKKLVDIEKCRYTHGSGVNLQKFKETEMPKQNSFLYLSRITKSKGVLDYIKAALIVKRKYPNTDFKIYGPIDNLIEKESVYNKIIEAEQNNVIKYCGISSNVEKSIDECRFFIYPSYYPEGVPRSVLQALSVGRPVITCNSSGCKDTVIDNKNGFLIEPFDYDALASKMIWLIENPIEAEKMGLESRKLAEEKFDVEKINEKIIGFLKE